MVKLSVNINKVATLRNARGGDNPNVLHAARVCMAAGCHGITVHPRPDERHIRRSDVVDLAGMLAVEFNIEGYPDPAWMDLVCRVRPAQATLVPDAPHALTSDAGWDLRDPQNERLRGVIARLHDEAHARVSLFVEADPAQIERAAELGADRVELYTEPYASAFHTTARDAVFERFRRAAEAARQAGLGLNAGHDLDMDNLPFFAENTPGLQEVSIGHALICDALYRGLENAVKAYLACLPAGKE